MLLIPAARRAGGGGLAGTLLALGKAAATAVLVFFGARVPRPADPPRGRRDAAEGALRRRGPAPRARDGAGDRPRRALARASARSSPGSSSPTPTSGTRRWPTSRRSATRSTPSSSSRSACSSTRGSRCAPVGGRGRARPGPLRQGGRRLAPAAAPRLRAAGRRDRRHLAGADRRVRVRSARPGRAREPDLPRRLPGRSSAATIISMVATPFLFRAGPRRRRPVAGSPIAPAARRRAPADAARAFPTRATSLIFGLRPHGRDALARARAREGPVPGPRPEPGARRGRGRAKGVPIEYGDTTSDVRPAGTPASSGPGPRSCCSPIRARHAATLPLCRSLAPEIFLLARTRYLAEIPELSALGADEVVAEEFETSPRDLRPDAAAAGFPPAVGRVGDRGDPPHARRRLPPLPRARRRGGAVGAALPGAADRVRSVGPDWRAVGKTLSDLRLRPDGGAIVLAVVRSGQAVVTPGGELGLEANDQLLLLGTEAALERTIALLRGSGRCEPGKSAARPRIDLRSLSRGERGSLGILA